MRAQFSRSSILDGVFRKWQSKGITFPPSTIIAERRWNTWQGVVLGGAVVAAAIENLALNEDGKVEEKDMKTAPGATMAIHSSQVKIGGYLLGETLGSGTFGKVKSESNIGTFRPVVIYLNFL